MCLKKKRYISKFIRNTCINNKLKESIKLINSLLIRSKCLVEEIHTKFLINFKTQESGSHLKLAIIRSKMIPIKISIKGFLKKRILQNLQILLKTQNSRKLIAINSQQIETRKLTTPTGVSLTTKTIDKTKSQIFQFSLRIFTL